MNQPSNLQTRRISAAVIAKMALITALYVVTTLALAPFSFGAIQLRLSEMFNYLGIFNKRYIWSITLGVALANLQSPLGFVDVLSGSLSTCIVLWLSYAMIKHQRRLISKMVTTAVIFSVSMFTVAASLTLFYQLPFFYTWLTVAIGEFLSMTVGGCIFYLITKKINLNQ
ncbi:QueT transporter family protein [Enterococcus faecalis]